MRGELTYDKWLRLTKEEEQEMLAKAQEAVKRLKEQKNDEKDDEKDVSQ